MKKILYFLVIILLGSFLRIYQINTIPSAIYVDEAFNYFDAMNANKTGDYKVFYKNNNGREGLFINIQAILLKFLPTNKLWVLKIPSILSGILTLVGIYFLTKIIFEEEKLKEKIALWSMFFAATSVWHITFSRIGLRVIMAPLFLTWGLYFLLLGIKKDNWKNSCLLFLAGIIYGFGFYTYIAYRISILLIFLLFFLLSIKNKLPYKKTIHSFLFFLLGLMTITFPIIFYFLKNPDDFWTRINQVSIFSYPILTSASLVLKNFAASMMMFFLIGDYNPINNFNCWPALSFISMFGFIVFLGYNFFKKNKKYNFFCFFIISWILIGLTPFMLTNKNSQDFVRTILIIPPLMMACGFGITIINEHVLKRYLSSTGYFLKIIIIVISISQAFIQYFIFYGNSDLTKTAFNTPCKIIAENIEKKSPMSKKYILIKPMRRDGVIISKCTLEVIFYTDTYSKENRKLKNIYYVYSNNKKSSSQNDGEVIMTDIEKYY